ncbi:MAG: MarR family transcriptional regulator [Lachnospiraceae bacterium]|nr:MarR family transcriptional regulator [Lachnospiraceae bacterium]
MKKDDIGYLIKLISDRMRTQGDAELKQYDLTFSQVRILSYLHRYGPKATQKEIEAWLDVAHPTVVGLVSRLEKNGFVECYPDPQDRRNKLVGLTPKSYEIKERVDEKKQQNELQMAAGLLPEEQQELIHLLKRVYANLEQED